jgi:hypothetical protein
MTNKLRLAALALMLLSTGLFAEEGPFTEEPKDDSHWDLLEGVVLDIESEPPKAFFQGKEIPMCEAAVRFLDATVARAEAFADTMGTSRQRAARILDDRWESVEILTALCLGRKPYVWRLTPEMREQLRSMRES